MTSLAGSFRVFAVVLYFEGFVFERDAGGWAALRLLHFLERKRQGEKKKCRNEATKIIKLEITNAFCLFPSFCSSGFVFKFHLLVFSFLLFFFSGSTRGISNFRSFLVWFLNEVVGEIRFFKPSSGTSREFGTMHYLTRKG